MIKQIGLPLRGRPILLITLMISNGNRTEWSPVRSVILLHEKLLQFDWLRAVVFQFNLKYLHVKITNLSWVVV